MWFSSEVVRSSVMMVRKMLQKEKSKRQGASFFHLNKIEGH